MPWLTTAIETNCIFPIEGIELEYNGSRFILRPETEELYPTVSIELPDRYQYINDYHKIFHEKLKIFLSVLSWVKDEGVREITWVAAPNIMQMGKLKTQLVSESFHLKYLPIVKDDKALRALALFKEAKSINNNPYKFLGFFKILNILKEKGKEQKKWINDNIQYLKNNERINELRKEGIDIGEYLYEQGRCAIAHAFNDPIINPDNVDDILKIYKDLPLIEELVKIAIEREFKINSTITNWSKNRQ